MSVDYEGLYSFSHPILTTEDVSDCESGIFFDIHIKNKYQWLDPAGMEILGEMDQIPPVVDAFWIKSEETLSFSRLQSCISTRLSFTGLQPRDKVRFMIEITSFICDVYEQMLEFTAKKIESDIYIEILTKVTLDMPRDLMEGLEKKKFEKGESTEECAICLHEFSIGTEVAKMHCSHFFHTECIQQWFERDHNTCPMCRSRYKS